MQDKPAERAQINLQITKEEKKNQINSHTSITFSQESSSLTSTK
jgi:hypothetical protein